MNDKHDCTKELLNRTPEGTQIAYYTNGTFRLLGTPTDEDHNCDAMGCGSFGQHVLVIAKVEPPAIPAIPEEVRKCLLVCSAIESNDPKFTRAIEVARDWLVKCTTEHFPPPPVADIRSVLAWATVGENASMDGNRSGCIDRVGHWLAKCPQASTGIVVDMKLPEGEHLYSSAPGGESAKCQTATDKAVCPKCGPKGTL